MVMNDDTLQNVVFAPHILSPSVFLIYEVDSEDFGEYIDSRFSLVTLNNKSYIVMYVSNETAYVNDALQSVLKSFPAINVYTTVNYTNTLSRQALSESLPNPLFASICEPYTIQPYKCYQLSTDSYFSLNNQSKIFDFYSSVLNPPINTLVTVNLTVEFNPSEKIDYNDSSSIAGIYLNPVNNIDETQSMYQYGQPCPVNTIEPIFRAHLYNFFYTDLYQCTIKNLQSNYLTTIIGNIKGLNENKPTWCFYAPYHFYKTTNAKPIILN
ncbi:unnamed protein product [Adineta steineri]|uniref:Uncharacterized protein n=1 Tax=Adineta steineri TaxID=433720 RepID=A0A819KB41_9BILA|nr:unnamed protein product [Adineta steineri]